MTFVALACVLSSPAYAAPNIPITVNLSESVNVTGTPQIAVDVGGTTRYATYASGTGTNALTFTLAPQAGDVDLDGVTVSSPIQLNGGTIKDTKGNNATLTFTPPSTANVKVNYPSLGMDFVYDADGRYTLNGTAYNDLSSFLTATGGSFTRASTGTYFDSAGVMQTAASGAPRFDYDPVTHAAKGILIEESRTNILKYSSNISTNWSLRPGLTRTLNATASPDGATEAAYIQIGSGADKYIHQFVSQIPANGQSWVFSVWLWSNTITNLTLYLYTTSPITNVTTKTVTLTSTPQRFFITKTLAGLTTETNIYVRVDTQDAAATEINTGDFYMWGGQLEQGTFPTSYIPTTMATVTRAAEDLVVPTGSWMNGNAGTLFGEALSYNATATTTGGSSPTIASINMTAGSNIARVGRHSTNVGLFQSQVANVTLLGLGAWNNATVQKIAGSYDANGFAAIMGANALNTNGAGSLAGTLNQLRIGQYALSGYWSSTIAKVKYYPARVTDAQLQLLTQ